MIAYTAAMDDDFNKNTEVFLDWCEKNGVKLSPKAVLTDLRADGRGRALGKSSSFRLLHIRTIFFP